MKIAAKAVDECLRRLDPRIAAVLLYGPDGGRVRERADNLTRDVAGALSDPFRVSELTAASLRDDPARLGDEAAALVLGSSPRMGGGRRVIRLRAAGDALAGPLADYLGGPAAPALVVIEAGDLPPRSPLRRLFEGASNAAALPCYRDDAQDLARLVEDEFERRGLSVGPDALAYLVANLGDDRAVTRSEIDKLALYMGDRPGRVELADAVACVGDSAAISLDDVVYAAADGDLAGLDRAVRRGFLEGQSAVSLLRAAARHFLRLHFVAGAAARGGDLGSAIAALRPPVFFKLQDRFRRQVERWPVAALADALDRLIDAEIACKRTGAPDRAICQRALMEAARLAGGGTAARSAATGARRPG